ncbi:MAG: hypothetical protein KDA81_16285 [Planctomycetaceae bacterium]|nr:hypothetical protein [Planctomycetaceae bacterium]
MALLLGLSPLLLVEGTLRLFGVMDESVDADLHGGLDGSLFEKDDRTGVYRTRLAREQFFVTQEFPVEKADNEYRIFCLGGSTVQGRPWRPETSFGQWAELELNHIDPSRKYQVINCGGISYASYRLTSVLQEVLTYDPDLIILATGHNEFLEDQTYAEIKSRSQTRLWLENASRSLRTVMLLRKLSGGTPKQEPQPEDVSASEGVEARLDDDAGYASYHRDDTWHEQITQQFENSVRTMLSMCSEAGVPVLTVRLGANLRDSPPFKSELRSDISTEDAQRWQQLFEAATAAEKTDLKQAIELYKKTLDLDDRYPLVHFRIARCLDRLGQSEQALTNYQAALDLDICPLRITSRMQKLMTSVSEQAGVPCVDAETLLRNVSADHIPGFDRYVDHVHPSIVGHQMIGRALVQRLVSDGLIQTQNPLTPVDRRLLFQQQLRSLGTTYIPNGRRRIGWLEGWARRQRLFEETLPVDTRGFISATLRYLDLHDYDVAKDNLKQAVESSDDAEQRLIRAAADFYSAGQSDEANWLISQLSKADGGSNFSDNLALARLVLALDRGSSADIDAAVSARTDTWANIIRNDATGWAAAAPDLLKSLSPHEPADHAE